MKTKNKKAFSTILSLIISFSIFWFLPFVYEFSPTKKIICFGLLFLPVYYLVSYFLYDILIKLKDHASAQNKNKQVLNLVFILILSGVLFWGLTKLPTFRFIQGEYKLTITAVSASEEQDNIRFLLKADSRNAIPINRNFSATYIRENNAIVFRNPGDQFRASFYHYKTSLELCFSSSNNHPYPLNVNLNGFEQVIDLGADGIPGKKCYQIPVQVSFQSMYAYWKLIWIARLLCLVLTLVMIVSWGAYLIYCLIYKQGNKNLVAFFDSFSSKVAQEIYKHKNILLMLLFFTLIAFGGTAFNMQVIGDDWAVLTSDQFQYSWVVQTGRWLIRYVWAIAVDNAYANSFSIFFLVLGQTVSAFIIIKMLRLKRNFAKLIFCAIFIFHPIYVNAVLQRMIHLTSAVGILSSCLFGYTSLQAIESFWDNKNLKRAFGLGLMAVILFSLAASINQVLIFYGVIAFLATLLVNLLDSKYEQPFKDIGLRLTIFSVIILLGLTLYFIKLDAFIILYQLDKLEPDAAYSLQGSLVSSIDELIESLNVVMTYMHNFLFTPQYFMPLAMKIIFLFFLGYLFCLPFTTKKQENASLLWKFSVILLYTLIVTLILVTPWSLGTVRNVEFFNKTFRYNALRPLAALYAVIIGIVLDRVTRISLRRIVFNALSVILVVIFLFQHSASSFILHNLNNRDRAIANRILYMIESHPDYHYLQGKSVAKMKVIGNSVVIEDRPFEELVDVPKSNDDKVICGMFNCQQDRLGELLHLLQYGKVDYQVETITEFTELTGSDREIISTMTPYPDVNSIKIFDNGEIYLFFGLDTVP